MIDYKIYDLAKKVRASASAIIKNESEVVQSNERRVSEAMDVINLCNMVIAAFDKSNGIVNLKSDRDVSSHHSR